MIQDDGRDIKRLFWDTETSPNLMFSWRAGYKINLPPENIVKERAIICICYKWQHSKKIGSLVWDKGDDRQMLEDFTEVANSADEMIYQNGDRFDLPWFNGRNLMHGLPPLPDYKTVDTLAIARRKFYFNSYKLDYLAWKLLGMGKIKTSFQLWKDITLPVFVTSLVKDYGGSITVPKEFEEAYAKSLKKMVTYCKRDVTILQQVWEKMRSYYKPKTHIGVLNGGPRWSCTDCGSESVIKSKTRVTPTGMKRHQMYCKDCGRYNTVSDLVFRGYLKDKVGEVV